MAPTIRKILRKNYEIKPFQADFKKHLKINALFNIFEELADTHSGMLGHGQDKAVSLGHTWLIHKVKLRFQDFPRLGHQIKVCTAPQGIAGLTTIRNFQVWNHHKNIIAEATSSWILVHQESKRPQRIHKVIDNIPQVELLHSILDFSKLSMPPTASTTQQRVISYSDLDSNNHVNNSRYIEWITDSFPVDFLAQHRIKEFQIEYQAEGKKDEIIEIRTYRKAVCEYIIEIYNLETRKTLCTAHILFEDFARHI